MDQVGGAWVFSNPTELHLLYLKNCSKTSPWYRKAVKAAKGTSVPDFRSQAAATGSEAFENVLEKVEKGRAALANVPIDTPHFISELLDQNTQVAQLAPHFINHEGVWRKCIVFKQEAGQEGTDVFPIWLLTRGSVGWEPDVRVGVMLVERERIHTKDSRKMEEEMRKAEIGEVTRVAITLGDVFPNVTSVERALLYFPQCFTPHREDDSGFSSGRFAVREEVPYPPLEQFGNNPNWTPGSFTVAKDKSVTYQQDTPTGGPLVGAPSWPTADTKCVECKKTVEASLHGPVQDGVVLPSFVGRTNRYDSAVHEFMHLKCQFANNERNLVQLEFIWNGSYECNKSVPGADLGFTSHKTMLTKNTSPHTVFPILLKKGVMPETDAPGAERWWIGEKGIIHVFVKDKQYEFLHFPRRKLVFLLSVDGKPVSKGVAFEEGKRPFAHVLNSSYAKPSSGDYHLLVKRALHERDSYDALVAQKEKRDAEDAAKAAEAEAAKPPSVEVMKSTADTMGMMLSRLTDVVVDVLDKHSYLLHRQDVSRNTTTMKASVAALLDADSDDESLSAESENVDNQVQEEKVEADEDEKAGNRDQDEDSLSSGEAAMLKPAAEDDGDEDLDSDEQRDIEDRVTSRRPAASIFSLRRKYGDRGLFDILPYISLLRLMQTHASGDKLLNELLAADDTLAALNAYITVAAAAQEANKLKGYEVNFPKLCEVTREGEWAILQLEYGVGLPESHYTQRFMVPPYKKMRGLKRGVCKALSQITKADYANVLMLEALILCRSIDRRKRNIISSPLLVTGLAEEDHEKTMGFPLRKLYHEESLWMHTMHNKKQCTPQQVRAQVAAQLMVPLSRVVVCVEGSHSVVRVKGVQEQQKRCAETPFINQDTIATADASTTQMQTSQLLQLYQLGECITNHFGCFKGTRGKWLGAVGPDVTHLNYVLRGMHTPFTPTADRALDSLLGAEGQWVYEERSTQKPLEGLLGRLPDFKQDAEGVMDCRRRSIESFIAFDDECESDGVESVMQDTDDEDLEEGEIPKGHVRISYTFVEYQEFCQLRLDILSGTHEGESTTIPVYKRSPVLRMLYEADITDDLLSDAICNACSTATKAGVARVPRISELYWLLLPHTYDRDAPVPASIHEDATTATGHYPWRFHLLFKRFGLTMMQSIRLAGVMNAEVEGRIDDLLPEIDSNWRDQVRVRHFNAWMRINEAYSAEDMEGFRKEVEEAREVQRDAERDLKAEQRHKERNLFGYSEKDIAEIEEAEEEDRAAALARAALGVLPEKEDHTKAVDPNQTVLPDFLYEDEAECPSHGIDLHPSSALNDILYRIMQNDPVGRTAVLRSLHLLRGEGGEQRYTWHETCLVDSCSNEAMPQGLAGRLAKKLRKEVRCFGINHIRSDGLTGEPADSEVDTQSSNWDAMSDVASETSQNPCDYDDRDAEGEIDITRETLDPFSKSATAQFDVGADATPLLGASMGSCGRCSVTVQNMHRFADYFVRQFTRNPEFVLRLAKQAGRLPEAQLQYVKAFDNMISALHTWAGHLNKKGTDSLVTQEARATYLQAVQHLWSIGLGETYRLKESDDAEDDSSEDSGPGVQKYDDEEMHEREVEQRHCNDAQKCSSGLCLLWDLLAGIAEEVKITDMYMRNCTAFSYSMIEALQPAKAPLVKRLRNIEAFLDKLAQYSPMPAKRSFLYEHALFLIDSQPVATLFYRFLQRNSTLVTKPHLIARLEKAMVHTPLPKMVCRATGGIGELIPVASELRPYHRLAREYSFGEPFGHGNARVCLPATSFEEALCVARANNAGLFIFNTIDKTVELLRQRAEKVAYTKLAKGCIFCVSKDIRKYEGMWLTLSSLEDKLLGDNAGPKRWAAAQECRMDPCDNVHKSHAQFRAAHKECAENAWRECEDRRVFVHPNGDKRYVKKDTQLCGTSMTWDDLPECRRFPTNGHETFDHFTSYDLSPASHGSPEGKYLTYEEFVHFLGKKRADRVWPTMEMRRLDPETNTPSTKHEFFRRSDKVLMKFWEALPVVDSTPNKAQKVQGAEVDMTDLDLQVFTKDAPPEGQDVGTAEGALWLLYPTQAFLDCLHHEHESTESEAQFAVYANNRFPIIHKIRVMLQYDNEFVSFAPQLGDFTERPYFVFSLCEGIRKSDVVSALETVLHSDDECQEFLESSPEPPKKRVKTQQEPQGRVDMTRFFTLTPIKFAQTGKLTETKQLLREVRYSADMSKNLQKLFKDREAAYPEEVLRLVKKLRYELPGNFVPRQAVECCETVLHGVGCRRVLASIVRGLGAADLNELYTLADQGTLPLAAFIDTFTTILVEDWTKPLQPSCIAEVTKAASHAGWMMSERIYDNLHSMLLPEGAHGVLDWAVRSMMYCHRPLSFELRTASLMVNVIRVIPIEVRKPFNDTPVPEGTELDWSFNFFNDTRKFETKATAQMLEDMADDDSIYEDMYTGHKVDESRAHKRFWRQKTGVTSATDPSSLTNRTTNGEPIVHEMRPLIYYTDKPVRITSYKVRSEGVLQPVEWRVEGALLPHSQIRKLRQKTKDIIDDKDMVGCHFAYMHRHTERWSRPIDENDFVPPIDHKRGRWVESDLVEVYCEERMEWRKDNIVTQIDSKTNQPTVTNVDSNQTYLPGPEHIRHQTSRSAVAFHADGNHWYGSIGHTPGQWSHRFTIPDSMPLVYATKQAPPIPEPVGIGNWQEVSTYHNPDAEIGDVKTIKLEPRKKHFAMTRVGESEGMVWEMGTYIEGNSENDVDGCYSFRVLRQGIPGCGETPPEQEYTAWMPRDDHGRIGAEFTIFGRTLKRQSPKRLFCLSSGGQNHIVEQGWSFFGAYDLVYDDKQTQDASGRVANPVEKRFHDQPVWRSVDEMSWLFADRRGRWAVSTSLGGPSLLQSEQNCLLLPGMCNFRKFAAGGEYKECEGVFFLSTNVKFDAFYLHEYMKRLGIDRRRMHEMGFDADDDDEVKKRLHTQLSKRAAAETRAASVWEGIRLIASRVHKSLDLFKNYKDAQATPAMACLWQCVIAETTDLKRKVLSMFRQDHMLDLYEQEREEDDVIAEAALAVSREKPYLSELASEWANKVRIADGCLYSDNRNQVMHNFFSRFEARRPGQVLDWRREMNDPTFKHLSEACLEKEQTKMWEKSRFVLHFFSLVREVLREDIRYEVISEKNGNLVSYTGSDGVSVSVPPMTKKRRELATIVSLVEKAIADLDEKSADSPWKVAIKRRIQVPLSEMLAIMKTYFSKQMTPGRKERAADILASTRTRFQMPHEVLGSHVEAAFKKFMDTVPYMPLTDFDEVDPRFVVNWDEVFSGTRLRNQRPDTHWHRLVQGASRPTDLKWPFFFLEDGAFGDNIINNKMIFERKANCTYYRHFADGKMLLNRAMHGTRAIIGTYVFGVIWLLLLELINTLWGAVGTCVTCLPPLSALME